MEHGKLFNNMRKFTFFLIILTFLQCMEKSKPISEYDIDLLKREIRKNYNETDYTIYFSANDSKILDEDFIEISEKMYLHHKKPKYLCNLYLGYIYTFNKVPFLKGNPNVLINELSLSKKIEALDFLFKGAEKNEICCLVYLKEYYLSTNDSINFNKYSKLLEQVQLENRKKINDSLKR